MPAKKETKTSVRRNTRKVSRKELSDNLKAKVKARKGAATPRDPKKVAKVATTLAKAAEKALGKDKLTPDEVTRQALAAHFGGPKPTQPIPTGYEGLRRLQGPGLVGAAVMGVPMSDDEGHGTVGVSVRH